MGSQMWFRNDTGTISAIPYAVLTVVVFGLFLVGMGVVVDALVEVDNDMMRGTTVTTPDPGQIAAGLAHALHLTGAGTVVAWGDDYYGQASPPAGLSGVTAIAAGGYHSLALKSDGTVVAWGDDYFGQASPPAGLSGVTAIAAGDSASLALKSDGTVVGWGRDIEGQATPPAGLSDVVAIAAAGKYSLALKSDGTVVHWGDAYSYLIPPSGLVASQIAGGYYHGLALGGFPPTASFTRSPSSGEPPLTVQFTDTSTGTPTSWHWDFGDGNISTLQNPSHTYTAPGDYTVTLTVTNAYGEDTKTSYVHVYIPWAPSFTASPTSGPAPLTVQFTDTSTDDPFDWWWEFGDGDEVFSVQNPSHTYTKPGTYTVTLHAVNRYEEVGEVTREGYITVFAAPTPTDSSPSSSSSAHSLPYSQQRKETLSFLLMCWEALAFVGVFCVVIFLLMNGAQRGSGGI